MPRAGLSTRLATPADAAAIAAIYNEGIADRIAAAKSIDMPITRAVAEIIEGRLDVRAAMASLMSRPITTE